MSQFLTHFQVTCPEMQLRNFFIVADCFQTFTLPRKSFFTGAKAVALILSTNRIGCYLRTVLQLLKGQSQEIKIPHLHNTSTNLEHFMLSCKSDEAEAIQGINQRTRR